MADHRLVTFNPNKTEVLFCSLISNERHFCTLTMFNLITLTTKGFGLSLSDDRTMHEHY
jgi:hypothetical protein